jgi:tetratricopeptide (TPR) repeat protein
VIINHREIGSTCIDIHYALHKHIADRFIQLKPDYADAYYNRGLAYINKGKTENAKADLKKTLEYCGDNTTLCQQAQQELQQLGEK